MSLTSGSVSDSITASPASRGLGIESLFRAPEAARKATESIHVYRPSSYAYHPSISSRLPRSSSFHVRFLEVEKLREYCVALVGQRYQEAWLERYQKSRFGPKASGINTEPFADTFASTLCSRDLCFPRERRIALKPTRTNQPASQKPFSSEIKLPSQKYRKIHSNM